MPLAEPRQGELLGFSLYPEGSKQATVGDPEAIIWSSIHHLCSRSAAEYYAWKRHGVSRKTNRSAIARNLRLYIQQASDFYQAAKSAKANTAPLIYYYSFLNLAKAVCEMQNPNFHRKTECYSHGLTWRPDPRNVVNFPREKVILVRRGVWHALWESLTRQPCPAANPTPISVQKLFSYCHEVSAEYLSLFGLHPSDVDLLEPGTFYDEKAREVWLRFSIRRQELLFTRLSAPTLIAQMEIPGTRYLEVKSTDERFRTFESTAKKIARRQEPPEALRPEIVGLNLFAHFGYNRELEYSFPLQRSLPLRLPQLVISYTLLFWLGSLVRYDPHSVHELVDSPFWILIDGFMSQSRLWLLELFKWALYQEETTLLSTR